MQPKLFSLSKTSPQLSYLLTFLSEFIFVFALNPILFSVIRNCAASFSACFLILFENLQLLIKRA